MLGAPDRKQETPRTIIKPSKTKKVYNRIKAKYSDGTSEVIFLWGINQWFLVPGMPPTFRVYQLGFNFDITTEDGLSVLRSGVPGDYVTVDMSGGAFEINYLSQEEKRQLVGK